MGLSGPKKRNKISSDPNNTTWANNKDGYGQRILASQGWKAGDYLGAKSANHADHYTAANASHIRVMLREDNLGLGAQLGKSTADTFGLATLSGIFGRLNGKSDAELQKQQDVQRDLHLQSYQTQKFGTMNFVSGGLLVGDKMEFPSQKMAATQAHELVKASEPVKAEKTKKRKAESEEASSEPKEAKERKQVAGAYASTSSSSAPSDDDSSTTEGKKRKKLRHEVQIDDEDSTAAAGLPQNAEDEKSTKRKKAKSSKGSSIEKTLLKKEKLARKEERRLRRERKEEKRRQKGSKVSSSKSSGLPSNTSSDTELLNAIPVTQVQAAPAMFGGSRHAVRQRYIQQKRLASMDPRAVKEILMLKSSA